MDEIQNEAQEFLEYLETGNLSKLTIQRYLEYYSVWKINYNNLSQKNVNRFLSKHTNSTARAFMKNFLDYHQAYEIHIRKITKTKAKRVAKSKLIPPERLKAIIKAMYDNSQSDQFGLITEIIGATGIREDEALNIRKKDFDLEKWGEEIQFENDSTIPCELLIRGKGDKHRIAIIPAEIMLKVYNYMNGLKDEDKLFPFTASRYYKKLSSVCERLGYVEESNNLKGYKSLYSPHKLRFTFLTNLHRAGVDIMEIRNIAGHSSVSTTQTYISVDEEESIRKQKERIRNLTLSKIV
jgi:integrase